jgi:hypothetical protein
MKLTRFFCTLALTLVSGLSFAAEDVAEDVNKESVTGIELVSVGPTDGRVMSVVAVIQFEGHKMVKDFLSLKFEKHEDHSHLKEVDVKGSSEELECLRKGIEKGMVGQILVSDLVLSVNPEFLEEGQLILESSDIQLEGGRPVLDRDLSACEFLDMQS